MLLIPKSPNENNFERSQGE